MRLWNLYTRSCGPGSGWSCVPWYQDGGVAFHHGVGTLWVVGIMSAIGRRDQSLKVLATKIETLVELQTELVQGRIQMESDNKLQV